TAVSSGVSRRASQLIAPLATVPVEPPLFVLANQETERRVSDTRRMVRLRNFSELGSGKAPWVYVRFDTACSVCTAMTLPQQNRHLGSACHPGWVVGQPAASMMRSG